MADDTSTSHELSSDAQAQVDELMVTAKAHVDSKQNGEAERLYLQSLDLMEKNPGQFGLEKSRAMRALGHLHYDSGKMAKSKQMFENAIQHLERIGGKAHPATLFAHLDLFDFHYRQGDSAAATALLHVVVPRAETLESTSNSILFKRLGWACGYQNLLDKAVSFFEQAYEEHRQNDPDSKLTLNAAHGLCLTLSSMFREGFLTKNQVRYDCIERLARVMYRTPQMQSRHPHNLAFLCLRAGDEESAKFAAGNWPGSHEFECDACQAKTSSSFWCRTCWCVDLCPDCHEDLKSGGSKVSEGIRQTCVAHDFVLLEKGAAAGSGEEQADTIKAWLSGLISKYSMEVASALQLEKSLPKRALDGEDVLEDDFEEFPIETKYTSGKLDDQCSAEDISVLIGDLQEWRRVWVFSRSPALLKRFFATDGFQDSDLPASHDFNGSQRPSIADISRQAEAIIDIASQKHHLQPPPQLLNQGQQQNSGHRQIYSALPLDDTKTIRVLKLLGLNGGQLQCEFVKHNLSGSVSRPFTALSYVWGKPRLPTDPWYVHVNGVKVPITRNLFHHLSAIQEDGHVKAMWVDALCIDQDNETEKSSQVALMADIYTCASQVLIYLGDPAPQTSQFVEFLNREHRPDEPFAETMRRLGLDGSQVVAGYIDVCLRPWWNRVWVQQEHAMASASPLFRLGSYQFTTANLVRDGAILHREAVLGGVPFSRDKLLYSHPSLPFTNVLRQLTHAISVVHNGFNIKDRGSPHTASISPPRYKLQHGRTMECSDPRDRIFGLRVFLDPVAQRVFPPDYKLSKEQLFERLAVWVLALDGWQEVFWWYPHRLSLNLPSWIPDFSRPVKAVFNEKILAHANDTSGLPLAIRHGILAAEGYLFDVVDETRALTDAAWVDVVGNMWRLDCMHHKIPTPEQRQSMPPTHRALEGLHTATSLCKWVDSAPMTFPCAPLALPFHPIDFMQIVELVAGPIRQQLETQWQKHESELCTLENDRWEEGLGVAWEGIFARTLDLLTFLVKTNLNNDLVLTQLSLLVGAPIYDYPNFCASLQHLCLKDRPCRQDKTKASIINSTLATISKSLLPTEGMANFNASLNFGMKPTEGFEVEYGALQTVLVDAEYDEEVKLRARITLRIAMEIRSRASRALKAFEMASETKVDNHLPFKESQIRDTRALELILRYKNPNASHPAVGTEAQPQPEIGQLRKNLAELESKGANFGHGDETMAAVRKEFEATFRGRTAFTTRHGLVGMGAQGVADIRPGDKLVLLRDTRYPLIVREVPDTAAQPSRRYHEIVGFAHVRGFSKDDFNTLDKADLPPRTAVRFR